jgi:(1->4)-alpha-D-glucan 1-alpha-D-glucosylmutase
MVMAKGVEDCAFYRYNRLGSLTEVGGEPHEFAIDVAEFHDRQMRRQSQLPHSMTALTTHDTKRGEDVRARLDVLSEMADEWAATLDELRAIAPLDDKPTENLLWQAIVGSWPASRDRLHAYAEKAARESGTSTTWTSPVEAFETRMHQLIDLALDDPSVNRRIEATVASVRDAGWSNGLAAKALQLTMPGMPDVYQGSELWETSLVDPDNRRPVDYALRRRLLADIDAGQLPDIDAVGAVKLLVTSRALRLRRDHPELFSGYRPVTATGVAAAHVVAFDRGGAITVATRLPLGLRRRGGWGDTAIDVEADMVDAITGTHVVAGSVALGQLLRRYPVAILIPAATATGSNER